MSQTSTKTLQNTGYYDPAEIKAAMEERGLSAEHVAVLSGKSVTTVYQVTNGTATKFNTVNEVIKPLGGKLKIDLGLRDSKSRRAVLPDSKSGGSAVSGRSDQGGGSGRSKHR